MSATPVVLSLAGTIQDTVHRDNVLIGQRVIGSISASGYSLTNHQWAVSGPNWFHHVDWGPAGMGPKGPYYEYRHIWGPPTGWDAAPTVQAYYDEDGDAVFTCSADVWVGGTLIGRATAERELKVWAPQYGYEYSVGASQFSPSLSNADWIGAEGPGMFVEGWVKTPDLFVLQGTGQWSFAQRVDLDWSQSLFTSPFPNTLNTNGYQLDNSWTYPYPELPWDADTYFSIGLSGVSWEDTSDSPGWQVFSNASALDMTSHFEMFEVYVPPSHSGLGDDIEWVPLHMIEWFWILHTSRGWGDPWPAPAPGIGVNSSESLPGWKLQWNSVKVDPA